MQAKVLVFSVSLAALSITTRAQDKIYTSEGDFIEAKIKSVGTKTITYQRFDNLTGPEYTIEKSGVKKIVYQNGSEDTFGAVPPHSHFHHTHHTAPRDADAPAGPRIDYKPDVLAIAPLQFSENGLGASISYERALDKDGIVAFYLPLIATWDLNNGTYVDNQGNTKNANADMMLYAMPGLKFYPTGSYGPVRYAIGPSLVIGSGQKSSSSYDYYTGTSTYITQQRFILGVMLSNSLNINPSPHIFIGLELGLGLTYLNRLDGLNQNGSEFLAQGGFKIGYRF